MVLEDIFSYPFTDIWHSISICCDKSNRNNDL